MTCLWVPRRPLWAEAVARTPTLFCVCCRCEGPLERERPVSRLDGRIRLGSDCRRVWVQSWDIRQEEGKSFLHGVQRADSVGRGAVGGWFFPGWIFGALQISAVLWEWRLPECCCWGEGFSPPHLQALLSQPCPNLEGGTGGLSGP